MKPNDMSDCNFFHVAMNANQRLHILRKKLGYRDAISSRDRLNAWIPGSQFVVVMVKL